MLDVGETMKICKKCGKEKPLTEYYKVKESRDGHAHSCKVCQREKSRKYREANPEKIKAAWVSWYAKNKEYRNEYTKEYYQNNKEDLLNKKREFRRANPEKMRAEKLKYRSENRQRYNESQKEWRKNNPSKAYAHELIRKKVGAGLLIKPNDCSCCGVFTETLHAHHDDYTQPLKIRWLCARCHSDWHKHNTPKI